jgi:hypothetical protein
MVCPQHFSWPDEIEPQRVGQLCTYRDRGHRGFSSKTYGSG